MDNMSPTKEHVIMNFEEFIAQDNSHVEPMDKVIGGEEGSAEIEPEVTVDAPETDKVEEPEVPEEPEVK